MTEDLTDDFDREQLGECIHRYQRMPSGMMMCTKCGITARPVEPEKLKKKSRWRKTDYAGGSVMGSSQKRSIWLGIFTPWWHDAFRGRGHRGSFYFGNTTWRI